MLCCGAVVLVLAALNGSHWLPSVDRNASVTVASIASPTKPAPAGGVNTLVYPVDARGHVFLDPIVNNAPVRFLLDTGASLVTLPPADALAAGFSAPQLAFNQHASTANGDVRIATVTWRGIRFGQLTIEEVPAAIIVNLNQSLLGMSFLTRL